MSKKTFTWMLMAAMVCGLSMSVASCKDDDKDDNKDDSETEDVKEALSQEETDRFWDVVGQLTSIDNYTTDYQGKTFEPTIGQPAEGNPYVRIVATNDMASAAQRFANLVGMTIGDDFPIDAETIEWQEDVVGKLTYRKTDNGSSWAEVEVSIKQLPHLQKIIYQAPEQMGTNASFNGSAYYRFGDVVKKKNEDGKDEYWVCVRPAFGKEGKGESHWVTLSPLPEKNIEHIKKYDRDFYVPKALGKNEEQMQNFAEMLHAMTHPEAWENNVKNNDAPGLLTSGLRMFHDFSHDKDMVKYHNKYFWQRVREAWDTYGLFKTILGFDSDNEQFNQFFCNDYGTERLHLLYSGYSWWSKVSGNLSLYEYTYEIGDKINELNMHKTTKREVKQDMADKYFDVKSRYTASGPYLLYSDIFGDKDPRYIIRHATGEELTAKGSKWDYKQPIAGVTPVYVYNDYYYPDGTDGAAPNQHFRDLTITEPEVTANYNDRSIWFEEDYEGYSHYMTGDVCIDENGSRWFCLLNSGCDLMDEGSYLKAPYSYFISFDNVVDKNGNIAKDIAQSTVVPKLMVPLMQLLYENRINPNSPVYSAIIENIMSNAKCNLLNMAVMRDTVVTVQGTQNKETRSAFCTNVAIPAADKQNWQVMRIVYDDTHGNTGNRGWNAHFYTKYGNTQTPILLKDIAEQDKVNLFGPDRWVVLPKHGQAVRGTYRTEADERAKDIKNYLWKDGAQQSDATSMWKEPVLVFRVDKVYDRGGNHSTNTWWNHQFKKFVLSKIHSDKSSEMFCQDWWKINSNTMYVENRLFMDGNPFQWENYSNDIFK